MKMNKKNAEHDIFFGSLDDTIEYLKRSNEEGKNIYVDFNSINGVMRLYSADIDENNAYLRIGGLTKEQKDNIDKQLVESFGNGDENKRNELLSLAHSLKEEYFNNQKKNATKIDPPVVNLDETIMILTEYKKFGENVYIDYETPNGIVSLYSIDINPDKAYISVIGVTKQQFEENRKKYETAKTEEEKQAVLDELNQMIDENKQFKTMK